MDHNMNIGPYVAKWDAPHIYFYIDGVCVDSTNLMDHSKDDLPELDREQFEKEVQEWFEDSGTLNLQVFKDVARREK